MLNANDTLILLKMLCLTIGNLKIVTGNYRYFKTRSDSKFSVAFLIDPN